jgi:hypothetical protein
MSVQSQMVYHLIINTIAPLMASSVSSMYTNYFAKKPEQIPTLVRTETDDEHDLDVLQMDRLLKWMSLVFDSQTEASETQKAYKRELYSLYTTIVSDYKQYVKWKKYNSEIWMSYYRKDTKSLAKRIVGDIKLFNEGLKMFTMFDKL